MSVPLFSILQFTGTDDVMLHSSSLEIEQISIHCFIYFTLGTGGQKLNFVFHMFVLQAQLKKEGVKVFQHNSRGENMILSITQSDSDPDPVHGLIVLIVYPETGEEKEGQLGVGVGWSGGSQSEREN